MCETASEQQQAGCFSLRLLMRLSLVHSGAHFHDRISGATNNKQRLGAALNDCRLVFFSDLVMVEQRR